MLCTVVYMPYFPVLLCLCLDMRCMYCMLLGFFLGFISSFISKGRLPSSACTLFSHLIVQIKVVKLSIGPEVLGVSVQGEVDITTVAFNHH